MRIVLPSVPAAWIARVPMLVVVLFVIGSGSLVWGQQASAVTVTWDPSTDPTITSYRVYFGLDDGSPLTLLTEVPALDTSAQVTQLVTGQSYCAEITAVRDGCESERSSRVCATPTNTGPTIIPLTPPGGDQCASRTSPLVIELNDVDDDIDQSSIVVLVNGVGMTPSIAGSGGNLTLTVALIGNPPADGQLDIEVQAQDLHVPPNGTTLAYSIRLEPPPPTGLAIN